jgi:uncharacterized protein (DUF1697 family)
MYTWIALIRGINVGGKNKLPMRQLQCDLESMQLQNVRTYIQSGNVVFATVAKTTAAALEKKLVAKIKKQHGLSLSIIVLASAQLLAAIEADPFGQSVTDPKSLHYYFLAKQPASSSLAHLEAARMATEEFQLIDNVLYLHAPDGIARSKLAANVEKYLGVVATARNSRTVHQLKSMACT